MFMNNILEFDTEVESADLATDLVWCIVGPRHSPGEKAMIAKVAIKIKRDFCMGLEV
jgi:hypothetical protein